MRTSLVGVVRRRLGQLTLFVVLILGVGSCAAVTESLGLESRPEPAAIPTPTPAPTSTPLPALEELPPESRQLLESELAERRAAEVDTACVDASIAGETSLQERLLTADPEQLTSDDHVAIDLAVLACDPDAYASFRQKDFEESLDADGARLAAKCLTDALLESNPNRRALAAGIRAMQSNEIVAPENQLDIVELMLECVPLDLILTEDDLEAEYECMTAAISDVEARSYWAVRVIGGRPFDNGRIHPGVVPLAATMFECASFGESLRAKGHQLSNADVACIDQQIDGPELAHTLAYENDYFVNRYISRIVESCLG